MAEPKTTRTPIERKPAATGDHILSRKDEAIRAEIDQNPNITARQIAENLERRGMSVSMSHIYRQLSNFTHRTKANKDRPWAGTNIGMPAPAGFSVPDTKAYLDNPKEYGGRQRTKETIAALEEVDRAIERGHSGTASTPSRTTRSSRTKGSKMSRH